MEDVDKLREKLLHIRRALLELKLAEDLDLTNGDTIRDVGDKLHMLMDSTEEQLKAAGGHQ